jgi:hypothetical protein
MVETIGDTADVAEMKYYMLCSSGMFSFMLAVEYYLTESMYSYMPLGGGSGEGSSSSDDGDPMQDEGDVEGLRRRESDRDDADNLAEINESVGVQQQALHRKMTIDSTPAGKFYLYWLLAFVCTHDFCKGFLMGALRLEGVIFIKLFFEKALISGM